jgi:hypothetical protein
MSLSGAERKGYPDFHFVELCPDFSSGISIAGVHYNPPKTEGDLPNV